jgi:hypothetical protein
MPSGSSIHISISPGAPPPVPAQPGLRPRPAGHARREHRGPGSRSPPSAWGGPAACPETSSSPWRANSRPSTMPLCRLMPPVAITSGAASAWHRAAAICAGAAWFVPNRTSATGSPSGGRCLDVHRRGQRRDPPCARAGAGADRPTRRARRAWRGQDDSDGPAGPGPTGPPCERRTEPPPTRL